MRRIRCVLPFVVLLATACGDDGPTGPDIKQIGGTYTYSESTTDAAHNISCNSVGTLIIVQSGTNFSGTTTSTSTCTGPGGAMDFSGAGTISGGTISGNSITFQAPFCQIQGTVSGDPVNSMSGTSTCTFQEAGETFTFNGTWQASR